MPELTISPSGHEMQFATNHLGHFALAVGLHEALAAAGGARIVSVSSRRPPALAGRLRRHRLRIPRLRPVRRLRTVQDRQRAVRGRGHPALGRRRHHRQRADARRDLRHRTRAPRRRRCTPPRRPERLATLKTVEQGAATSVLLAASPLLDGVGGRYFEDCNEAQVVDRRGAPRNRRRRTLRLDPANAERLWDVRCGWPGSDARRRHRLPHRRQAARGAGGKDVDALRCSGAPLRHRRPDRAAGRRGGQPRQAPVHPGRRGEHPLASEDGRQLAGRQQLARPSRAGHRIRIILEAGDIQAAGVDLGVLEILERANDEDAVAHLGPDLLGDDWEPRIAAANLSADPDRPLGRDAAGPAGDGRRRQRVRQRAVLRLRASADGTGERGEGSAADGAAGPGHAVAQPVPLNRTTTGDTRRGRRCGSTAGPGAVSTLRHDHRIGPERRPGHVLVPRRQI